METLSNDNTYIWRMYFGSPGAKNDINILRAPPLFRKIRAGKWPRLVPDNICIDGEFLGWL